MSKTKGETWTGSHMDKQIVDKDFRLGAQFKGSSGSAEGAGIKTTSFLFPEACMLDMKCPFQVYQVDSSRNELSCRAGHLADTRS